MTKFKSTRPEKPKGARAVGEAYLKSHRWEGLSKVYYRVSAMHVRLFYDYFRDKPIDEITPEEFLRSMPASWGNVARNNYHRTIRTMCEWARDNDFIPYDRRTFPERAKKRKAVAAEPEFFAPTEMRQLLNVAGMLVGGEEEWLLSLLVLGGFTGVRTSEFTRLRWEDIDLVHKAVRLSQKVTKTSTRRIAVIPDNGVEWLRLVAKESGPVFPQGLAANLNRYTGSLAKEAGVEWKVNGLRHSYVTYAMAQERNAWKVAEQVGNSPKILQGHYKGLVLESDAAEWFGITPDNTL